MKYLFVLLFSIFTFILLPCSNVMGHHSVTITAKNLPPSEKTAKKSFRLWKIQKKRHSNPAPVFLIVSLVAGAAAVAVYLLTPLVTVAAVLGGIAFIGFILYFVYSGAN